MIQNEQFIIKIAIYIGAYLILSLLISYKWHTYKNAFYKMDDLLIGDIIINIICFPITLPILVIELLIKLFNYKIK